MRRLGLGFLAALALSGCRFAPELSSLPECGEDGGCPSGSLCWTAERRCVPECGEDPACDAGEPSPAQDAGADGGDDAGQDAGFLDAGDGGVPPLWLDAGTPLRAVELEGYAFQLQAAGGVPPYEFIRVDGGLPPGIQAGSDGLLLGTPTLDGLFPFEVKLRDQAQDSVTGTVALRVAQLARIGTKAQLTDALSGQGYGEQLYATGGVPPYRWTVDAGSALPAGLSLSSGGALSGTLTGSASHGLLLVLHDSDVPPQERRRAFSLTVKPTPLAVQFSTQQLADGRVGAVYRQQLQAAGGTAPLQYSITAGALPDGVGLSSSGLIDGTPADAGTYSVTVQVRDSTVQSSSAGFSVTIH